MKGRGVRVIDRDDLQAGHPRRRGQDPLRHRRCRRRLRARQDRLPAAGEEAVSFPGEAAAGRGPRQHRDRGDLLHCRAVCAAGEEAQPGAAGADQETGRRQESQGPDRRTDPGHRPGRPPGAGPAACRRCGADRGTGAAGGARRSSVRRSSRSATPSCARSWSTCTRPPSR